MMDAIADPGVERVVFMTSSQVGKTEILNNILGWLIHLAPSPILVVQPTLDMARAWASDRLEPMARDTPELEARVRKGRTKDGRASKLHKTFPGGHVSVVGANAPASLASRPIRVVLCDEVDRFPVSAGDEGDPIELAVKRTTTFHDRKVLLVSTPTTEGESRVELAYEDSDRRVFMVPCPRCGAFQHLVWAQIVFEEYDPSTARYRCEHCDELLEESDKREMLAGGYWSPRSSSSVAGFHISELYSPWSSWERIVAAFLKARKQPALLKVWTNTSLGETWNEDEKVDADVLEARAEPYALAPPEVLFVTGAVDVQADRLEVLSRGWGPGRESWALEYHQIPGDPTKPEVWIELDKWRKAPIAQEGGRQLFIDTLCVDSGYLTSHVYDYCRPLFLSKVYAVKGKGGPGLPIAYQRSRRKKEPERCPVFTVGADAAKDLLMLQWAQSEAGPGCFHFHNRLGREYFEQLCGEVRRKTFTLGRETYRWVKIRERNEALDLEVYNLAALHIAKPRLIGPVRRPETESQLDLGIPVATPGARRRPDEPKGWTVK